MIKATYRNALGYPGQNVRISQSGAIIVDTVVDIDDAAVENDVYLLARLPSAARVHGISELVVPELADSNTPTADIGVMSADGRFEADDDVLHEGLEDETVRLIAAPADYGKTMWELSGLPSDPGGFIDITLTIKDDDVDEGGTCALVLAYSID